MSSRRCVGSPRARVDIVGFSEMSVSEVSLDSGLPIMQAQLAKLRDYEEPFRLISEDMDAHARLRRTLQAANVGCISDGRYEYAGAPVDVGLGAQWLTQLYRRIHGTLLTIGIGDKLHHLPLLRRVDIPVIVTRDDGAARRLFAALPRARLFSDAEPYGLADVIASFLDDASLGAVS